eukprot:COSAG01_NODE_9941_length_2295_cov_69.980874_4_plen_144_part_00
MVPVGKVGVVYTHAVACGKVSRAVRNWQCSAYSGGGVVGRARDAAATTNAVLGVRPALHRLRSITGNGLLRNDGAGRHVAVPRGQRRVSGEQQQPTARAAIAGGSAWLRWLPRADAGLLDGDGPTPQLLITTETRGIPAVCRD